MIGASDAGAHLDLLASFNYTTVLLGRGRPPAAACCRWRRPSTSSPTCPPGSTAWSTAAASSEGWHADLVVLDPATVASDEVAMRFDLPGGAGRLYAEATGIDHVLVNGRPIVSGGVITRDRPGTILRSGRDTTTPELV